MNDHLEQLRRRMREADAWYRFSKEVGGTFFPSPNVARDAAKTGNQRAELELEAFLRWRAVQRLTK